MANTSVSDLHGQRGRDGIFCAFQGFQISIYALPTGLGGSGSGQRAGEARATGAHSLG